MRKGTLLSMIGAIMIGALGCPADASNPIRHGWPPCEVGAAGYWQSFHDLSGREYVALTDRVMEFHDPARIKCWLRNEQAIQVIETTSEDERRGPRIPARG